ncbi:acyltransferase-domain-containing protein [Globomyces pollinis-pini]|nr:acyltransferase-domain-containing protein [Globomyces pollinis-pini]
MESLIYYVRVVAFIWLILGVSFAINIVQLPGLLLYFSRPHYRTWMRFTQRLFGSLVIVATYLFAPLQIVMTGEHVHLNRKSFVPIMANHQIYTDWWYVWIFSYFRDSHGELKIILKESLKSVPILGWGMKCFEFIFLARVWKKDQDRIVDNLVRAKNDKNPMWLLVFPEGTVITEGTKANSRAYAKKKDITDEPKHVLLPKSTGLYHILRALESDTEYLYDFTMGYSGLTKDSIPYDAYPPSLVFFKGQGPQAIHIHVDRIKIADIPGLPKQPYSKSESATEEFDVWLRKRFMVKDELMKGFYENGQFPISSSPNEPGLQQILHLSPEKQDWISIIGLVFASIMSWSWLFL